MKRKTAKALRRHIIRARNELRKKWRLKERRHTGLFRYGTMLAGGEERVVKIVSTLSPPQQLCFDQNCEETLRFFRSLRHRTLTANFGRFHPRRHVGGAAAGWVAGFADIAQIKHISPGAALILAAEHDRMRKRKRSKLGVMNLSKWDKSIISILHQLGFFKMLDIDDVPNSDDGKQTEPLHVMSMQLGEDAGFEQSQKQEISTLFAKAGGDKNLQVALSGAVLEAIENVKGHAYQNRSVADERNIPPFWWLSGSVNERTRTVTLVLYDQGITIPASLPQTWSLELVIQWLQSAFRSSLDPKDDRNDGKTLQMAMQVTQTSTKLPYRGKGLQKIRNVVEACTGGKLRIISRRGSYLFHNGREEITTLPLPLLGTYLELEATF